MRRWFLSYNSQDLALMQAFEAGLRRKDTGAEFFFAPRSMRAGGYWLPELAREIAQATAFVLLVGGKGIGPWQLTEYCEAIDRRVKDPDFPVVLVLLEGEPAPGLPFLRQLNWIVTADPASEASLGKLIEASAGGGTRPGELWRHTAPYRGLAAMTEADSDFFFGRARETIDVIRALETTPDRLPILLGNSGVGKSSLAQAGVLAALARQAWPQHAVDAGPWPQTFHNSRRWCFLTLRPGVEPVKALVQSFLRTWQLDPKDTARAKLQANWVDDLSAGTVSLRDLLDATELHYQDDLHQPKPPAYFLYIDQGEELYARSQEHQRRRFSEILAQGLGDPRLRALMSLRSDFLGGLQTDEPLFNAHHKIDVPPLRQAELREVVGRPAELLAARFEAEELPSDLARRAAEESVKDGGALPLLSYLLDDMWTQMVSRGDGVLRLPPAAMEPGGVLAERADAYLALHPGAADTLRRVLTLRLAAVREDGEPTRRHALRSEFSEAEWSVVSELADHPYRLLVVATPEGGESYAEVAHEAIFRRWDTLREWIAQEREFLIWRNELEMARRRWDNAPEVARDDALLMGLPLMQAQGWVGRRAADLPQADRDFIASSLTRDETERAQRDRLARRARQMAATVGLLFLGIAAGLAWSNRGYLTARTVVLGETLWPRVLTANAERALTRGNQFKECAGCPEMVVVPAGEFTMGSPVIEQGRASHEGPQHAVTIAQPFAVAKHEVTSDEWDACVTLGGCAWPAPEAGWGRGRRPVMNVSFEDAQQYAAWLSRRTGKPYRLLSEAEWEYSARAGSDGAYAWGGAIGKGNANCNGCGSAWDNRQTAPVGSFAANAFGLHDMHGNVWEWVADCYQQYDAGSRDAAARIGSDCSRRVVRGGSWSNPPAMLRAANRISDAPGLRDSGLGFRVARTLTR